MEGQDDGPLEAEALKRDEWRGGDMRLRPADAPGYTLPASEQGFEDAGSEAGKRPRTIAPPD